jgi:hypothetical protein
MADSSYTKILKMMRSQGAKYNPPGIKIGTVITADPLTIQLGDLPLYKNNLFVADYLLSGYKRQINIPSIDSTEISFTDGLKENDQLAVIKIQEKKYLILCKVEEL